MMTVEGAEMGFFHRHKDSPANPEDEPVELDDRSPQLGIMYKDLMVLGELMKAGADMSEPRHVMFYLYAGAEATARSIAAECDERGLMARVQDPAPERPGDWAVICEAVAVLTPEFVREHRDYFDDLAVRHQAEYDGWEASV